MVTKVRQIEVAKASGMSLPTVSRILSGKGSGHSAQTREKVVRIALRMGYRPMAGCRPEVAVMSKTIVVIGPRLPSTDPGQWRADSPDWLSYGALARTSQAGYVGLLMSPEHYSDAFFASLLALQPAGAVLPGLGNYDDPDYTPDARIERFRQAGICTILYGDFPPFAGYDRVISDHELGSYQLTRHLLERGARRIGNLWSDKDVSSYWCQNRRLGYERAMLEAGVEPLPDVLYSWASYVSLAGGFADRTRLIAGYLAPSVLGPMPLDAITLNSDQQMPVVAAGLRLLGKAPNRDILVAGYDNCWPKVEDYASDATRPIATVDKGMLALGNELVQLLLDRLEGRLPDEPQVRKIASRLVVSHAPSEQF